MDTAKLFSNHNPLLDSSKQRVLSFGEGPETFDALQVTDTLCPISRGYIQLSGPDSRRFLQGQVTCDMQTVTGAQVVRGAHCTPKGRIIFLFSAVSDRNDNILLETHSSVVPEAIANLKKYAVFFKTEITDLSAPLTTFLIAGPGSAGCLEKLNQQACPQLGLHIEGNKMRLRCLAENHYSVTCWSEDSARSIAAHEGLTPCGEAFADLDAFDGVDAHHASSKIGIELGIDRRADAGGHTVGDDLDEPILLSLFGTPVTLYTLKAYVASAAASLFATYFVPITKSGFL